MAVGQVARGHAIAAAVLGAIELTAATIVVVCSFILASKATMEKKLTPYWAAIPMFIPGILGIVTGATKNHCAMIAFMVLNIIVFILQGIGTILAAIVVAVWAAFNVATNCNLVGNNACYCFRGGNSHMFTGIKDCDVLKDISILLYVIVVFLVIATVICLASSIVGCISVCCTSQQQPGAIIIQQPPGGNILMTTHQGGVMVPAPPPNYYQPGPLPAKY